MGYELIVVGTSFGGLQALGTLLEGLPKGFGAAVVIVQHRSKDSDDTLTHLLQDRSRLPIREAEDKLAIAPGHVYIAPADYHLLVDGKSFALSTDPPVVFSRPSIDVLFEAAAEAYRERVVGVVLTGANADGAKGLRTIRELGGYGIVQAPESAVGPTMPLAAINIASPDEVVPLERVAERLVALVGQNAYVHPSRSR
jgi:two-component system chemotaxis response regulator CheB